MMFGGDDVGALVMDFGSSTCKVGFAGKDTPQSVFPSVCQYSFLVRSAFSLGALISFPRRTPGDWHDRRLRFHGTDSDFFVFPCLCFYLTLPGYRRCAMIAVQAAPSAAC
jgi:hypothetical protein